ncbi:RADIL protein, partial [Glareola pratincola]|nr:RADIL protein [Glareola pratincola]
MFYGSSSTMAPPSKNRLKRQSRIFSQVLYRTLSYKDRSSTSASPAAGEDDPAELSTQLSAPGVLKIFGGNICAGTNYKSVLATGSSGARELVKEALERYGLSQLSAGQYALCDVIGKFEGPEKRWQTEGLRVLGDHEKPLLIQDLWKPREGFSRRLELRKRAEVEELAAKDVDTTTAGQSGAQDRGRVQGDATHPPCCPWEMHPTPFCPCFGHGVVTQALGGFAGQRCSGRVGSWGTGGSGEEGPFPAPPQFTPPLPARQDSLVYLLNREQHTVGQRTQASKPSISLSAPDILPLHCTIRKLRPSRHRSEEKLVLEPIAGAGVSVNFTEVARAVVLRHGDLLSLGLYYLLLYKDPMKAQPLPAQTLLRLRALHPAVPEGPPVCGACGSLLKERDPATKTRGPSPASGPRAPRRKLLLEFEPAAEDVLLQRIMTLIEPGGDDHKLTPAFLLCLCIQHSATSFEPGDFGQLLLKVAKMIQRTVWVSRRQDPATLSRFSITDLLPDLQHILFWMANAIEVLYFVQQKSPTYIQSMEEELDVRGSKESLFSSTITASEEAMTVLEEVVMYTFQQCVYYISKGSKVSPEPSLLQAEPPPQLTAEGLHLPQHLWLLGTLTWIYFAALGQGLGSGRRMGGAGGCSPARADGCFASAGSSLGCFHWSQGVKLRASVRLLLEWLRGAGFEQLAQQFFAKLASVANLLAMPGSQLVQMTWPSLRAEFPALSPAQLHRVLSQCQAVMDVGCIAAASLPPSLRLSDEMLESFDNHPPIILPSGGFRVDLEVETLDDNIYRHLLYIRHFLWSLQSKSPHAGEGPGSAPPKVACTPRRGCSSPGWAAGRARARPLPWGASSPRRTSAPWGAAPSRRQRGPPGSAWPPCEPPAGEPQLQEKLKQLQLGRGPAPKAGTAPTDPSCLLTPPTPPPNFDSGSPESPQGTGKGLQDPWRNGMNGTKGSTPEGCSPTPYDYPTPESSSRSSATDDFCYVFVVELERGPIGLGMGLIDGLHTPLCSPGIYIRTLIEDSPAATDGRLSIGDRILAVNGTSLIGADYQSAVDLIRSGGKKLRFLVAKSDMEIAKKI